MIPAEACYLGWQESLVLLGKLVEVNTTEKLFTAPDEKLTEDYVTGRFG